MTSFFVTAMIILSITVICLFVMPTNYVQTKINPTPANTQQSSRSSTVFGVVSYNEDDLQSLKANHETLDLRVVGKVVFGPDVTPELVVETVSRLEVHGTVEASQAVLAVLPKE
jgi:Ribbon-Helix-Helix transcriptional regulator family